MCLIHQYGLSILVHYVSYAYYFSISINDTSTNKLYYLYIFERTLCIYQCVEWYDYFKDDGTLPDIIEQDRVTFVSAPPASLVAQKLKVFSLLRIKNS